MKTKRQKFKGRIDTHFILPVELYKRLKEAAIEQERSVNKQVVFLLSEALSKKEEQ